MHQVYTQFFKYHFVRNAFDKKQSISKQLYAALLREKHFFSINHYWEFALSNDHEMSNLCVSTHYENCKENMHIILWLQQMMYIKNSKTYTDKDH